MSVLRKWYPAASHPLIISAPMLGIGSDRLASEVCLAGGIGFIPGGYYFGGPDDPDPTHHLGLAASLSHASQTFPSSKDDTSLLPVGVGLITCNGPSLTHFKTRYLPLLQKYRPSSLWLFAPVPPKTDAHEDTSVNADLVKQVRESGAWGKQAKIWIQVGTVAAARQAVRDGADVVVAQGVDAGGHQFARGAGTIGIVPEVVDAVLKTSQAMGREIAVVAAGGIADGRGVASVLALGAEGAVMGTRFVVSKESIAPDFKKQRILAAHDGGVTTVKSKFHDDIQENVAWPSFYDGRAIVNPGYLDFVAGVPLGENIQRLKKAKDDNDMLRLVTWSGTGVGLVKKEQSAKEIVEEVRTEAREVIKALTEML